MAREIEIKETAEVRPFYMVYVMGKCCPVKTYDKEEYAKQEAKRLCEKEHVSAYVLKSVCGYGFVYGIEDINIKDE